MTRILLFTGTASGFRLLPDRSHMASCPHLSWITATFLPSHRALPADYLSSVSSPHSGFSSTPSVLQNSAQIHTVIRRCRPRSCPDSAWISGPSISDILDAVSAAFFPNELNAVSICKIPRRRCMDINIQIFRRFISHKTVLKANNIFNRYLSFIFPCGPPVTDTDSTSRVLR